MISLLLLLGLLKTKYGLFSLFQNNFKITKIILVWPSVSLVKNKDLEFRGELKP